MSVKKLKGAYERYLKSDMTSILHAYTKPSVYKVQAWEERCKGTMREFGGHDLRIIGKNCSIFTAGFVFEDMANRKYFCYITPSQKYLVSIDSIT